MSAEQIKPSKGKLHVMSDQWGDTDTIIYRIISADNGIPSQDIPPSASYIGESLVLSLRGDTIRDTCRAIYDFVTTHIDYVDDNNKPAVLYLLRAQPDADVTDTDLLDWAKSNLPQAYAIDSRTGHYMLQANSSHDWQVIQQPGELWANRRHSLGGTGLGGDCKSMTVFSAACIRAIYGDIYRYRFISQEKGKDYHHVYAVVTDERGRDIILDCVEDSFDKEVPHQKQKDMYPGQNIKVGALAVTPPAGTLTRGGTSGGTVVSTPSTGSASLSTSGAAITLTGGSATVPPVLTTSTPPQPYTQPAPITSGGTITIPPAPQMDSTTTWLLIAAAGLGLYLLLKD